MPAWQRLSSRDIIRDRWVRLRADRCLVAPGHEIEPYYVLEENEWVHTAAFDADGRLLLVRQYRYAADTTGLELPGGNADPGEPLLATAQRELLEETGCIADNWRHLAAPWANPARQNNRVHLFVADHARIVAPQALDATESITVEFHPVPAVLDLLRRGEIAQANHLGLIFLALDHRGQLAR